MMKRQGRVSFFATLKGPSLSDDLKGLEIVFLVERHEAQAYVQEGARVLALGPAACDVRPSVTSERRRRLVQRAHGLNPIIGIGAENLETVDELGLVHAALGRLPSVRSRHLTAPHLDGARAVGRAFVVGTLPFYGASRPAGPHLRQRRLLLPALLPRLRLRLRLRPLNVRFIRVVSCLVRVLVRLVRENVDDLSAWTQAVVRG